MCLLWRPLRLCVRRLLQEQVSENFGSVLYGSDSQSNTELALLRGYHFFPFYLVQVVDLPSNEMPMNPRISSWFGETRVILPL